MMNYERSTLKKMGEEVATRHLRTKENLNDAVEKVARHRGLSADQAARVCEFANHAVNASHMDETAYTDFDIARPEVVAERLGKTASFYDLPEVDPVDEGIEKQASRTRGDDMLDAFVGLAAVYNVPFHADYSGMSLEKAAEAVAEIAISGVEMNKVAIERADDEAYKHIREALISGVPIDRIQGDLDEMGASGALARLVPRLEAEGLIPASHFDDAGPYSMQRAYKRASMDQARKRFEESDALFSHVFDPECALAKAASRSVAFADDLALHAEAAEYAVSLLTSLTKEAFVGSMASKASKSLAGKWGKMKKALEPKGLDKAIVKGTAAAGVGAYHGGKAVAKGAYGVGKKGIGFAKNNPGAAITVGFGAPAVAGEVGGIGGKQFVAR